MNKLIITFFLVYLHNKTYANYKFTYVSNIHIKSSNMNTTTKVCTSCKLTKDNSKFYKKATSKSGLTFECKKCSKIRMINYCRTRDGLVTSTYSNQKCHSKSRGDSPPNYTKNELKKWIFSHPNFEGLYINWTKSGYKRDLKPSCDRTDDYRGYDLKRLNIVAWYENRENYDSDRLNGINKKQLKAVIGTNKTTKEKLEFYSISEAYRQTKIGISSISRCCNKILKSAGGYTWEFKKL